MNYFDLDLEARELDGTLFNVLRLAVKGAKNIMLDCVQFPSYVQGIIVLFRHADISKNDRITRAFESMDALSFNGDALVWQSEAMRKTRELFDSGASIMHYVLSRVMKSFDGKLKTIQYKIAEDINRTVINDHTNVFDMVQSCAADIASVGDSKAPAMQVQTDGNVSSATCGFCNFQGHTEDQCRKKRQRCNRSLGAQTPLLQVHLTETASMPTTAVTGVERRDMCLNPALRRQRMRSKLRLRRLLQLELWLLQPLQILCMLLHRSVRSKLGLCPKKVYQLCCDISKLQ